MVVTTPTLSPAARNRRHNWSNWPTPGSLSGKPGWHYTPATGNIPGAWVRRGDWKLIRFFCDGPDQADRVELYNLREDIGETKDLAAANPQTFQQLDALISAYLRDTKAILPKPNPAYRPDAKPPAAKARPARRR